MNAKQYDVCIIGAGIVGMFTAVKLASSGLKVLLIENTDRAGGQLNMYPDKKIHNLFPLDEIKASDFTKKLLEQTEIQNNINLIKSMEIINIQNQKTNFSITICRKNDNTTKMFQCKYLILAYGKGREEPNKIPLIDADKFENKNIFYEVRNKQDFANKDIVIAGGSDSAIDWAIETSKIAKTITVVHRREINKPENPDFATFQDLIKTHKVITKIPYTISKIQTSLNENFVGVEIKSNTNTELLNCDYLLAFYGLKSVVNNIDLYNSIGINITQNLVNVDYRNNQTNVENIYAVGDCCIFDGKIANIFMGFADSMRCVRDILTKEKDKFTIQKY